MSMIPPRDRGGPGCQCHACTGQHCFIPHFGHSHEDYYRTMSALGEAAQRSIEQRVASAILDGEFKTIEVKVEPHAGDCSCPVEPIIDFGRAWTNTNYRDGKGPPASREDWHCSRCGGIPTPVMFESLLVSLRTAFEQMADRRPDSQGNVFPKKVLDDYIKTMDSKKE